MARMSVADAKNHFSDVLRRAEYGGERVIVERHGKAVAAIVSTEDLRRLEAAEDAADLRNARAALAEAKAQGTIPARRPRQAAAKRQARTRARGAARNRRQR